MACCWGLWASAQTTITFNGTIFFGSDGAALPGYPLRVYEDQTDAFVETITDDAGNYEVALDLDLEAGQIATYVVETFDLCTGQFISFATDIEADTNPVFTNDFTLCSDFNPPPPPEECEAFFSYEVVSDDLLTLQFFDLSYTDVEIGEYLWDFGDGNTSAEAEPAHTYATPGEYTVTLTIVTEECTSIYVEHIFVAVPDPCDCEDIFEPVCVEVAPLGFTIDFPNECQAICSGFSADDFVDCGEACICPDIWDPVCVVTDEGIIITFGNACEAECQGYTTFTSCGQTEVCQALFTTEAIDSTLTINFIDNSVVEEGNIIAWNWDFGDGTTSAEQNPTHTYAQAGNYVVILTIITDDGCGDTELLFLFIDDGQGCDCEDIFDPVCIFNPVTGLVITYDNECQAICAGADNALLFDCDEICNCPDIYDPVCVTLDGGIVLQFANSCEAECGGYFNYSSCDIGTCAASLSFEYASDDLLTIAFTDFSQTQGEEIVAWSWEFGDGSSSTEQNPTHTYAEAGDYIVSLTITTSSGCVAAINEQIRVGDSNCLCTDEFDPVCVNLDGGLILPFPNECEALCAGFTPDLISVCDDCICPVYNDPVCVLTDEGETLTFSNACEAECAGYTEEQLVPCNDNPCGCSFDFEPVCILTDTLLYFFPNECFALCEGFEPDQIDNCDILNENCLADFSVSQPLPENITLVQFTDLSFTGEGEITEWMWDFGDGTVSMEQNPSHQYAEEGAYTVTLSILTSTGCANSFTQQVVVSGTVFEGPECQAIFFFDQHTDDNLAFTFVDLSLGEVDSWFWDFGDGTTSTAQNPEHTYASGGVYTVSLTITSGDCSSTINIILVTDENIWYDSECTALFVPFIIPGTLDVFFLNLSSSDAVEYLWEFGDGTTSTEPIAGYQYPAAGTYTASLTITTSNGCTSTYEVTFNLNTNNIVGNPTFRITSVDSPEVVSEERIAPNPTQDQLTVDFNLAQAGNVNVLVRGMDGRLLQTTQMDGALGANRQVLNVQPLSAGLYILQIQTANGLKALKFVKE